MATSLPVQAEAVGVPSVGVIDRELGLAAWLNSARFATATAANRVGPGLMPAVPDAVKRLMARSVMIDGNTLDPTLRVVAATEKLSGQEGLSAGGEPAICRQRARERSLMLDRKRIEVGDVTELSIPGPAGPIPARHYRPQHDRGGPLLVFFHGGGWVIGDLDTHDGPCRSICRGAGIHVLSVAYRLAPEHPAPAGLEDAYAAYRWALERGGDLGTEPGAVAVGGDSAGGALAAVISQRGRDDGVPPLKQFLIYPATDMRGGTRSRALFANGFMLTRKDMDWFQQHYLTGSGLDEIDPLVSPILGDLSGLPPALVITAGFDPLRDEGEAYAAAMRDAGVIVDLRRMASLTHLFIHLAPLGGGSAIAMAETNSALRAHLCYR